MIPQLACDPDPCARVARGVACARARVPVALPLPALPVPALPVALLVPVPACLCRHDGSPMP